jgi:hypothetical protein
MQELSQYQGAEAIIVEHASQPNFAQFLRQKLGIIATANLLRYDGRPWCPLELAKAIQEADNA